MEHKTSEAKRRAIRNYDDKFERVSCNFDKGTVDQIKALGYTANSFIRQAIAEKLDHDETILGKK